MKTIKQILAVVLSIGVVIYVSNHYDELKKMAAK
jgi:hypothetical protein